jgi:hypothetical protein
MSFCPICGAHHDPTMPCTDRAGEILRDTGIKSSPMPKNEFKKTVRKTNRIILIVFIILGVLFFLEVLLPLLISK